MTIELNGVVMNRSNKRKVSALDVFAVLLMLLCAAGVIVRAYVGSEGTISDVGKENGEYTVSFEVTGVSSAVGAYITEGENLYGDDGVLIGTVGESVTVTPAVIYFEDENGKYIQSYSNADNGEASLVDVKGTMSVNGRETASGFLANGKTYLSPNFKTELHTKNVTLAVRITDIAEVGN